MSAAPAGALTEEERRFLQALEARSVRFLVIAMTAAVLQGARDVTEHIDLWFERADDPRIGEAARVAGGFYVSGSFGMRPPALGGPLGDRLDVVTHVDGVEAFDVERARAVDIDVEGVVLPVMPLPRVLASKRASGRPKDLAQIPAIEEALAAAAEP